MSLCLSTGLLFSFKASDTASEEIGNMDNYTVNETSLQEFIALNNDWQANGGPQQFPTCNLLRAGVRYARAVWTATGKQAFYEALDVLLGPSLQIEQDDLDTAEAIGIIQRL